MEDLLQPDVLCSPISGRAKVEFHRWGVPRRGNEARVHYDAVEGSWLRSVHGMGSKIRSTDTCGVRLWDVDCPSFIPLRVTRMFIARPPSGGHTMSLPVRCARHVAEHEIESQRSVLPRGNHHMLIKVSCHKPPRLRRRWKRIRPPERCGGGGRW